MRAIKKTFQYHQRFRVCRPYLDKVMKVFIDDNPIYSRIIFLGHVVNAKEIHVDHAKIEAIKKWEKITMDLVMLDTVGAEMRVVNKCENAISLQQEDVVVLTPDEGQEASSQVLPINFAGLAKDLKTGDTIFVGQYMFIGSETTSVWLEFGINMEVLHKHLGCLMIPSFWRMVHDSTCGVIKLVILDVQIGQFLSELLFITSTDKLWDVQTH
ncbi:pyruvate kinase [Tanacetum coccineum]|uniref:Pyruvate kinase n=1 Tax=Tanacetum coccineum TaxID=301880 RepID=A0ABQ5C1M6_9ASTR